MRLSFIIAFVVWVSGTVGCGPTTDEHEAKTLKSEPLETEGTLTSQQAHENAWLEIAQRVNDGLESRIDCHFPVEAHQITMLSKNAGLDVLLLNQGALGELGLQHIAGISSIKRLGIRRSTLGDGQAELLAAMPNLEILNIPDTEFTAVGFRHLCESKKLLSLRIGTRQRMDRLGECLRGLVSLRHLHLIGIKVDGASLEAILELPELQSLYLDDAGLSEAQLDRLVENGQHLHIHLDQLHLDRDGKDQAAEPSGESAENWDGPQVGQEKTESHCPDCK